MVWLQKGSRTRHESSQLFEFGVHCGHPSFSLNYPSLNFIFHPFFSHSLGRCIIIAARVTVMLILILRFRAPSLRRLESIIEFLLSAWAFSNVCSQIPWHFWRRYLPTAVWDAWRDGRGQSGTRNSNQFLPRAAHYKALPFEMIAPDICLGAGSLYGHVPIWLRTRDRGLSAKLMKRKTLWILSSFKPRWATGILPFSLARDFQIRKEISCLGGHEGRRASAQENENTKPVGRRGGSSLAVFSTTLRESAHLNLGSSIWRMGPTNLSQGLLP